MARSQTRSQTQQEGPYFNTSVGLAVPGRPRACQHSPAPVPTMKYICHFELGFLSCSRPGSQRPITASD